VHRGIAGSHCLRGVTNSEAWPFNFGGWGGSREGLTAPVGKASHVLKLENRRPRLDIGLLCHKKKKKNKKKRRNGEEKRKK